MPSVRQGFIFLRNSANSWLRDNLRGQVLPGLLNASLVRWDLPIFLE